MKDVIKSGGEWISSLQLEELIAKLPGVAEVAVVGVPDRQWGERLIALVVARSANDPSLAADVRKLVREHVEDTSLSKYAMPDRIKPYRKAVALLQELLPLSSREVSCTLAAHGTPRRLFHQSGISAGVAARACSSVVKPPSALERRIYTGRVADYLAKSEDEMQAIFDRWAQRRSGAVPAELLGGGSPRHAPRASICAACSASPSSNMMTNCRAHGSFQNAPFGAINLHRRRRK
jgi:hypothetical protein